MKNSIVFFLSASLLTAALSLAVVYLCVYALMSNGLSEMEGALLPVLIMTLLVLLLVAMNLAGTFVYKKECEKLDETPVKWGLQFLMGVLCTGVLLFAFDSLYDDFVDHSLAKAAAATLEEVLKKNNYSQEVRAGLTSAPLLIQNALGNALMIVLAYLISTPLARRLAFPKNKNV